MFRRDLIDLLRTQPMSISELARCYEADPRQVEDDLRHLTKSLRHTELAPVVLPARCRRCGFVFATDKLRKPGKCPACKGTWIDEPRVVIEGPP